MTPINKQPEPININIPMLVGEDFDEGKNVTLLYSAAEIGQLMKLREFLDKLIKWKVQGNPCHIMTLKYEVTEVKP